MAGLRLHLQEEGQLGHPRLELGIFVVAIGQALAFAELFVGRLLLLEGHVEICRNGEVVGR